MELKRVLTDDDAVSPVVGIVLMVSITVVVAALIGAFAVNLGGSQDTTPSVSWNYDYDSATGAVAVEHDGGDTVEDADRVLRPAGDATTFTGMPTELRAEESFSAGTGLTPGDVVKIVWVSPDGSHSSVIGSYEVP